MNKKWLLPLFTLGLVIVCFLIFKSVLTYIFISAVFALIGRPLFIKLKKIKHKSFEIKPGLAAFLTLITFYGTIFLFLRAFIPSIAEEANVIRQIDPQSLLESLEGPISSLEGLITEYSDEPVNIEEYVTGKVKSLISVSAVSQWINTITGVTGDLFISFFAISFITFFFLKDSAVIIKNIYSVIPSTFRDETDEVLGQVKTKLTRYFVGICIEVLLVFTFNAIGLWILGIDNFLIIALLAGIINVIPYVGPLIGIIFGCAIVLTTNYQLDFSAELLPLVGYTALIMGITQLLDNFLLQPLIYSNSVNAHPLEIFLVILIAGNIYGIIGMIVAIPVYSVVRVIIKEIRENSQFLDEIYVSR